MHHFQRVDSADRCGRGSAYLCQPNLQDIPAATHNAPDKAVPSTSTAHPDEEQACRHCLLLPETHAWGQERRGGGADSTTLCLALAPSPSRATPPKSGLLKGLAVPPPQPTTDDGIAGAQRSPLQCPMEQRGAASAAPGGPQGRRAGAGPANERGEQQRGVPPSQGSDRRQQAPQLRHAATTASVAPWHWLRAGTALA
jgi:hypothetical protein